MDSALFAIRERLPILPETERRIADRVLADPRGALDCNVAELARRSGASQAAVVRFCRRIGAEGFSDFKLRLSHDVFRSADERFLPELDLESGTNPASAVKGVIGSLQRSLARLESVTDVHLLDRGAEAISRARFTHMFGVGASGLVALDAYQKFIRLGIPCAFSQDTDLQITASCNLGKEDVAFVVSYSGETPSMVAAAGRARERGATVLTLTMDKDNSLKRLAAIPLVVPSLERVYRTGAAVSRINQLAVVDMLYALVISRDLESAAAAIERTMEATHRGRK